MKVEKGISCEGGFDTDKGAGKMCKAGMKASFHAEMSGEDMTDHIASELMGQINDSFMATKDTFLPGDDIMESLGAWDNLTDEDIELLMESDEDGGRSKTIKFGGFVKAMWGCQVTFEKKGGKFSKTAECGLKGGEGMGKAPKDDEYDYLLE